MIIIVIANVLFRKYKLNYDIIRKYFFYKKYNFYICNYIYLKIDNRICEKVDMY